MSMPYPPIEVDPREKNKRIFFYFDKLNLEYVILKKNLPVGDYKIGQIYCELKSNVNDAINSMKSRRANNQAYNLSANLRCSYFFFLGNPQVKLQDLGYRLEAFIAQQVSLSLRKSDTGVMGHINVITLYSELEFAYYMKHLRKRAYDFTPRTPLAKKLVKFDKKPEYAIPFMVEAIPGFGPELTRALLAHFGSIKAIINASVESIQEVPKIGPKKAQFAYDFVRDDWRKYLYTPKSISADEQLANNVRI